MGLLGGAGAGSRRGVGGREIERGDGSLDGASLSFRGAGAFALRYRVGDVLFFVSRGPLIVDCSGCKAPSPDVVCRDCVGASDEDDTFAAGFNAIGTSKIDPCLLKARVSRDRTGSNDDFADDGVGEADTASVGVRERLPEPLSWGPIGRRCLGSRSNDRVSRGRGLGLSNTNGKLLLEAEVFRTKCGAAQNRWNGSRARERVWVLKKEGPTVTAATLDIVYVCNSV